MPNPWDDPSLKPLRRVFELHARELSKGPKRIEKLQQFAKKWARSSPQDIPQLKKAAEKLLIETGHQISIHDICQDCGRPQAEDWCQCLVQAAMAEADELRSQIET